MLMSRFGGQDPSLLVGRHSTNWLNKFLSLCSVVAQEVSKGFSIVFPSRRLFRAYRGFSPSRTLKLRDFFRNVSSMCLQVVSSTQMLSTHAWACRCFSFIVLACVFVGASIHVITGVSAQIPWGQCVHGRMSMFVDLLGKP